MSSLLCAICFCPLETKRAVSTTCGHIFCSDCARPHFTTSPSCPVCRSAQTFDHLIHLFPEYGTVSHETSSTSTRSPIPAASVPPPRISLDITGTRVPWTQAGPVPACNKAGAPFFLGLAVFKHGLHPCKIHIEPSGRPVPYVPFDGKEFRHEGTTYLLPFDPATMRWVQASGGRLPQGARPVEGGYERIDKERLYHARAAIEGSIVLGKAGEHGHLGGAKMPYFGEEYHFESGYEVLCWRD